MDATSTQLRNCLPLIATVTNSAPALRSFHFRGPQAIKRHVSECLKGFPDLHFEIEQMIAEGDRVVSQLLMKGTHYGTWSGIPATGHTVTIRMITIHQIQNERLLRIGCWWSL
jgi:steroid delta-isomerase-like uncharacterized protein